MRKSKNDYRPSPISGSEEPRAKAAELEYERCGEEGVFVQRDKVNKHRHIWRSSSRSVC